MKLSPAMQALIAEHRLGFVATVNADGSPNLSPKGTFVVLDDEHIAFLDIRSPGTSKNLASGSAVEVNFVDPISRKGFRFKGHAQVLESGDPACERLVQAEPLLARPADRYKALVVIAVERAAPLVSPAYDTGASEAEVSATWRERFRKLVGL